MPKRPYTGGAQQVIFPSPWLVLINILDTDRWGRAILWHMHINIAALLAAVKGLLRTGAFYNSDREKLLSQAVTEAEFLGHNYVGTEHLLLAIIKDPPADLAEVLKQFNITHQAVQTAIVDLLDEGEYWRNRATLA